MPSAASRNRHEIARRLAALALVMLSSCKSPSAAGGSASADVAAGPVASRPPAAASDTEHAEPVAPDVTATPSSAHAGAPAPSAHAGAPAPSASVPVTAGTLRGGECPGGAISVFSVNLVDGSTGAPLCDAQLSGTDTHGKQLAFELRKLPDGTCPYLVGVAWEGSFNVLASKAGFRSAQQPVTVKREGCYLRAPSVKLTLPRAL